MSLQGVLKVEIALMEASARWVLDSGDECCLRAQPLNVTKQALLDQQEGGSTTAGAIGNESGEGQLFAVQFGHRS